MSLLRLFNLAMQGEAGRKGASSGASQIDLSILLNAIENTKGRSLLQALVDANAPTVFHMAITRLRGDFGFTGVIRKILGVMSRLPLQLAHLEKTHSAAKGGSLLLLLEQLRRSDDQTIETRAKEILVRNRGRASLGLGRKAVLAPPHTAQSVRAPACVKKQHVYWRAADNPHAAPRPVSASAG